VYFTLARVRIRVFVVQAHVQHTREHHFQVEYMSNYLHLHIVKPTSAIFIFIMYIRETIKQTHIVLVSFHRVYSHKLTCIIFFIKSAYTLFMT